jgi:hypothetical protein
MAEVAGDEVTGACRNGSEKDGGIFFGERNAGGQIITRGFEELQSSRKTGKAAALRFGGKVDSGFFQGVLGGTEDDVWEFPEFKEAGAGAVRGGEEDVGIEEEPVHPRVLFRAAVRNGIRVEAEFLNLAACPAIVRRGGGVVEQKFRFAFWCVFFNCDYDGRAKQDSVVTSLGSDERAFFDAEAAAELRRNDDGATLAYSGGIHGRVSLQIIGMSVYQTFGRDAPNLRVCQLGAQRAGAGEIRERRGMAAWIKGSG